jgi:hypothetical protein
MLKKKDYELIAEAYELVCLNERVYQLSNIEQQTISQVVKTYMETFRTNAKVVSLGAENVYKQYINKPIGFVEFFDNKSQIDKKIPVYVSFEKNPDDKGKYIYKEDKNGKVLEEHIILYYYKMKHDADFVEDALVHELFHAKQPYKTPGEHYRRSKIDYYTDPVEVHAYVSNIIKAIENEYLKSEDPSNILKFLEAFAREGKLPNLPESSIIKKIGKDEFVNYLYDNRDQPKVAKEHKKLVSKLHWLYNHLKSYENR